MKHEPTWREILKLIESIRYKKLYEEGTAKAMIDCIMGKHPTLSEIFNK